MANSSSKTDNSQAPSAPTPAASTATVEPARLSLQQWCGVTGQAPHRIRAFAAMQTDKSLLQTADRWVAQFADFNKSETR